MSDGGKGSKRRPTSISDEELQKRWDEAFKKEVESSRDAKIDDDWNEKRLDIIVSNGNNGLHYTPSLDEIYTKIEKDYNEGN